MTHKVLYVLIIPESSQVEKQKSQQRNVSRQGVVSGGIGQAGDLSSTPGQQRLVGWYRGRHADEMAAEFEELFSAQNISEVPFRGEGGSIEDRGYYALRDTDVRPLDPRDDRVQQFDGTMVKKGTKQSHWRALATNFDQVTNDFGNDTTGYVGVPSAADKARWLDEETLDREDPTLITTRQAELGGVDIYDAQGASFSDPTLIYELDYDEEGRVDAKVWDDHGHADKAYSASTSRGFNDVVQWQRVFDLTHEFEGAPIVENGLVRLHFDEGAGTIEYEDWDDAAGEWASGTLSHSDWELFDADLTRIAMARVEAHVEFRNASTGGYYSLVMVLNRGSYSPRWIEAPNETGGAPSGLQDMLDEKAHPSVADPQETKTLVDRKEAQK